MATVDLALWNINR
ncbi:Os12g0492701 [Oryza sativa Japonica Group]|uniref:Os12g0492701 protein n=2 Tax=Oryza sativa subsp. japonica TaxID=39947 RepID=C7J9P8_ORYSJ|nr:hypothetical protein LOC_Os12g30909 [Oryza sativa Japonica Group]BAH95688.1 Os12g0492701 [Oryza sativa Japonica Group]|eukprot:NP_001176960.1 Os12g0492701 [Oryza sativa Japonica Group]